jgi:hypothetical protein
MFIASENRKAGKVNVLLISSGSVASIKIPLIAGELLKVRAVPLLVGTVLQLIRRKRTAICRMEGSSSSSSLRTPH